MKLTNSGIAKITRPRITGILQRGRLLRLLDHCAKRPVIWLSAPAGSGKSSLVTSYLDEYNLPSLWYQIDEGDADIATLFHYMGLAAKKAYPRNRTRLPHLTAGLHEINAFTRRYFESLYRMLKQPCVLVFDNYDHVPPDSLFHEIMREGLTSVPDGINIIIMSRCEPPPVFVRLRASNLMSFIGWDEIRFDLEETQALILNQRQCLLSDEVLTDLYSRTEGWAAGIVLLLERMRGGDGEQAALHNHTEEEVFHYFAEEIFGKAGKETRDFLLKTSLLPGMTAEEAQELTGNCSSAEILATLNRNHFFTKILSTASVVYQYHPLFRGFLLFRAEKTLPAKQLLELRRRAAALLEGSGRAEPAADLMCKIGDWDGLARLVNACAESFITQGRTQTLNGWLMNFPEEYRVSSPWLLYWLGVCRTPSDPRDSRSSLEKAFHLFKTDRDTTGAFLSWSTIIDTFVHEGSDFSQLDRWVVVLKELLSDHPEFPSPEIEARVAAGMLTALMYRPSDRDELALWAERVRLVILRHQTVPLRMMLGNYLLIYYLWMGDFAKAGLVIDALRPVGGFKENDPLTRQGWHVVEAMYSWVMADGESCMAVVAKGMKESDASGVHLTDLLLLGQGVYSGLSLGDPLAAVSCLERMSQVKSPRLADNAYYQYQASAVAWYQGDLKKAIEHGKLAASLTAEIGCRLSHALCLIDLAVTLFDDGQFGEADRWLSRCREVGRGMNTLEYMCALHGARFAFQAGREKQGLDLLKQGLALGSRQGYLNMPRWSDRDMTRLCAKALEADIETGYVKKLIRTHNLVPSGTATSMETWPWSLRIYTLGRFELVKEGEPIRFAGKVQQKPLALLKAIIALGGSDVPVEQITDILWPDADGDLAHQSLEMSLYRLRKLIGNGNLIQLQERLLTLNLKLCWVDLYALELLLAKAYAAWKNTNGSGRHAAEAVQLSAKAVEIYRGQFLPADSGQAWALSIRERVRSKFLGVLFKLGTHWEQAKQWERAAEVFHKGLEVDCLGEEFYQHLMLCYQRLGRRSEAIAVYGRCRSMLSATLGIAPSPETETLYQSLRNGR